jgi:polysaccharide biosynthesis/export protein
MTLLIARQVGQPSHPTFGEGAETDGPLNLPPQSSLLQALASLGNTKSADFSRAYLMRDGTVIKTDLRALYVDGDVSQDLQLKGNDFLFIPSLKDPNVYVLGAVNEPRFIPYRDGLTLLEAVLEAGGFSPMARENRTSVVRKQQDDEDLVIPVRGKDLLQGDTTQNIELMPGDYVIVREGLF